MSDSAYAKFQARQKTSIGYSLKSSLLQRTCACDQHTIAGGECEACRNDLLTLRRSQRALGTPSTSTSVQENVPRINLGSGGAFHFGYDFSRIPLYPTQRTVLQTKLQVNQPGDVYEQEADQVAEQVMRMTDLEPPVSDDEDEAKNSLMRKQSSQAGAHAATDALSIPPIVQNTLNSGGGQPLDTTTQAFMEPRFGHDFSQVRVHTDSQAAESASSVNALAYTIGREVVFGVGKYQPNTTEGKKLLAHELTHIVQQEVNVPSASIPYIQRRALPNVEGRSLAHLTFRSLHLKGAREIVVEKEIVPSGERPGHFIGFNNEYEALPTAMQHGTTTSTIIAIIKDIDNHYHIFDTGSPELSSNVSDFTIVPSKEERGFHLVRWLNLGTEQPASATTSFSKGSSWRDHVQEASRLYDLFRDEKNPTEERRTAAEQAFVSLMAESLGIHPGEVHVVRPSSPARAGLNFDIDLSLTKGASGVGGIPSLPTTRTGELPEPITVTLGPNAFVPSTPIYTQMILRHEATHAEHSQLGIQWLERWRKSGDHRGFEEWLKVQLNRHLISELEYDLLIEQTQKGGGKFDTQTLATLEGFMAGYHLISVNEDEEILFGQLKDMALKYWSQASHEVQKKAVERLNDYYCHVIDPPHQKKFDEFLAAKLKPGQNPENAQMLYRQLETFAEKGCK